MATIFASRGVPAHQLSSCDSYLLSSAPPSSITPLNQRRSDFPAPGGFDSEDGGDYSIPSPSFVPSPAVPSTTEARSTTLSPVSTSVPSRGPGKGSRRKNGKGKEQQYDVLQSLFEPSRESSVSNPSRDSSSTAPTSISSSRSTRPRSRRSPVTQPSDETDDTKPDSRRCLKDNARAKRAQEVRRIVSLSSAANTSSSGEGGAGGESSAAAVHSSRPTRSPMSTYGVSDRSTWTAEQLEKDVSRLTSGIFGLVDGYKASKLAPRIDADGIFTQKKVFTVHNDRGWQAPDSSQWDPSSSRALTCTDVFGGRDRSVIHDDPRGWPINTCGQLTDCTLERSAKQEEVMRLREKAILPDPSKFTYSPWYRGPDPDADTLTTLARSKDRTVSSGTKSALSAQPRRDANRAREVARELSSTVEPQTPRVAFTSIGDTVDQPRTEETDRHARQGLPDELWGTVETTRQSGRRDVYRKRAFEAKCLADSIGQTWGGSVYGSALASRLQGVAETCTRNAEALTEGYRKIRRSEAVPSGKTMRGMQSRGVRRERRKKRKYRLGKLDA